jgi:hypothetical protein|tara:strand:+ start:142 stop:324 length:183 start_codon:yes stop_codon:yes gene_type:complete
MNLIQILCPTCFEVFEIVPPPFSEIPAELDYDCEVCCSPMIIDLLRNGDELTVKSRALSN